VYKRIPITDTRWSGNISSSGGEPVIFDPATYYGHAEAEWGMSWCAGLSGAFWRGYWEVSPKAPLFEKRQDLYTCAGWVGLVG